MLQKGVVINEIMFDPPTETYFAPDTARAGQWIELHNKNSASVDLGGWTLRAAVDFTFPIGTTLAQGSYLVIASNPVALSAVHGLPGGAGSWTAVR